MEPLKQKFLETLDLQNIVDQLYRVPSNGLRRLGKSRINPDLVGHALSEQQPMCERSARC